MTAPVSPASARASGLDAPSIRVATDADGAPIARLIAEVFAAYENCPFVPEEFPELAAPASHFAAKGGALWVAVDPDGRVIGSLGVAATHRDDTCELFKVYLERGWRGRGLAGAMLERAWSFARSRGATRLTLWSDTRFVEGHRFYRRQGFRRLPGIRALHDAAATLEYPFLHEGGQGGGKESGQGAGS